MARTRVKWLENKTFLGVGSNGHAALMTSGEHGPGVSPMQMLLLGLGGCSSVDVVEILRKQRQPLESLEIVIEGERAEHGARPWQTIHMHFILCGEGLDPAKVERAINLSVEKYCGAHATLSGVARINHDYEIQSRDARAGAAE